MRLAVVASSFFDFLKPVGDAIGALRIPFEWLLAFFVGIFKETPITNKIGAYGLAIIVLTIIVKTLLFPLFQTQLRLTKKSQAEQRKVAPELAELRKKYKKDPQKLNTEMMALYKEHGINPLSPMVGCLPTLAQLPILIGLYRAIYDPQFFQALHVDPYFLGLNLGIPASLSHPVTWILPILAGLTTFIQSKMMTPPQPAAGDAQAAQMAQVSSTMSLLMPLFIVYLSFQSFALQGLVLYWIISNLYSIFQQYTVNGWGQLPILGTKAPATPGPRPGGREVRAADADKTTKTDKPGTNGKGGKGKARSGSAKVLVGQTEPTSRRNRRR
jgi:YidC/Oxa1 family membrane protein insertase